MNRRLGPAWITATVTLVATITSAVGRHPWPGALIVAVSGAPITVLLLVRGLLPTPRRSALPSAVIGALAVPVVVIASHGVITAIAATLATPIFDGLTTAADRIRADRSVSTILHSGWALVMLIEYAIAAPLAEEALKPLGAILRRPTSRVEALMFGVAAGTGFAITENLVYATGWLMWWDDWLPISLMRMPGAALHGFGAGLVALGIYEARHRDVPGRTLPRRFATAFGVHAIWNATIAVTVILFSSMSPSGFTRAGFVWGTALAVVLTAIGAVVLAGLVAVTRAVAGGDAADPFAVVGLHRREGVAALALGTAAVAIPTAILVTVFPGFVAL